ncbi:J domain-containing protein [Hyalangium minutum]|uniref:J domain-containing protein n=1 Tax=Hyalangium minutum TaxID=394096 RepID=A0A085WX24_9BACT|nr:J domain-containing protein [Hyalangium minutum]KFE72237.1 hypothetical protein DB31_0499 [Hyalangium minutum]
MLNRTQRQQIYQQLNAIVATVRGIDPDAADDLSASVYSMSDDDLEWIAREVVRGDAYGWFWQASWKAMARAWLLVVFAGGPPRGAYDEPSPQVMAGHLNYLRTASEATLRAGIVHRILDAQTGRDAIAGIVPMLTDASRDAWDPSLFTDPTQHRGNAYRYIINALRPTRIQVSDAAEVQYLRTHRSTFIEPVSGNPNAVVYHLTRYYLSEPDALCSEVLSCSLISQAKKTTYQNMTFGFVLYVPKANICNAGTIDLVAAQVQNTARGMNLSGRSTYRRTQRITDFLSQLGGKARQVIPTPDQILTGTSVHGHNELIVLGTFMGQVRARALFVKVSNGCLWRSFVEDDVKHKLTELIFACAQARRIPVIPIRDDSGEASKISFLDWYRNRSLPREEPRSVQSSIQAVVSSSRELVVDDRFPNVQLSMGQARALLARELNVSPFLELSALRSTYRRFAVTHHPDKTADKEKQAKFVVVRGLLTLIEGEETGTREPLPIAWKKQLD